jgi:hypothetical protein
MGHPMNIVAACRRTATLIALGPRFWLLFQAEQQWDTSFAVEYLTLLWLGLEI